MSSTKDFLIHNGVLIKYYPFTVDKDFALPENITAIGNHVFRYKEWMCSRIVIPKTVETIGDGAFACWLPGSAVKEIVIEGDIKEVGESAFSSLEVDVIRFEGHVEKIGKEAFICSRIGKLVVAGGIGSIGKGAFERCSGLETIDTPWIGKIGKDVFADCKSINVDAVTALLANKPKAPAKSKEKKVEKAPAKPSAADEALCKPWHSIFDEKALAKTFAKLKGTGEMIAKVRLADGKPAPAYLVMCATVPYAEQFTGRPKRISEYKTACYETKLVPNADAVMALLDHPSLMEALEKLRAANSAWLIPYGRYAADEQVKKLLADMKAWGNWDAYSSSGRSDIIIARGALLLNDTREAMLQIDKVGQLDQYARVRGTDAATIRDTVMSEFGFDQEHKLHYDLGGNSLIVTIGEDLSLRMTDGATGKEVKSVPKKNADPELHKSVSDHIKTLKKDIRNVVVNRKKAIFAEYLSGASLDIEKWKLLYLKNPVLNAVARLVVWCQDDKTFTLSGSGPVDHNGDAYTFGTAPVKVAHPVEMGEQLRQWQDYFVSRGLKQPFEQVWEPAYKQEDIKPDRYKGCVVSVNRVINMEAHGIRSFGFKFYSDNYGFHLTDCSMVYDIYGGYYQPGADIKMTLGKFSFRKMTRYVNHIIYLFDKWTASDRILADDVSVVSALPAFTVAQITEFIRLANENGCTNVLGMLMEYKNRNFADFDPMAEFSLDL